MFYLSENSTIKKMGLNVLDKSKYPEFALASDEIHHVMIGNDVWIGQNVSIINGVSIGDGAIIATGAVVTKNVPPFSVVGGVPAKVLKMRFDEETIEFLKREKWWDKDIADIKKYAHKYDNIENYKSGEEK